MMLIAALFSVVAFLSFAGADGGNLGVTFDKEMRLCIYHHHSHFRILPSPQHPHHLPSTHLPRCQDPHQRTSPQQAGLLQQPPSVPPTILLPTPRKVCPRPPRVEFATAAPDKRVYEPGEHVLYTCQPGYVHRAGHRQLLCPKTGRWGLLTMKCGPRTCIYPGPLENGVISHAAMTFQSGISFSCNQGYNLIGATFSQCTETGKWSEELPRCEPVICPPPPIPDFGKLVFYKPKPDNTSIYQDVVKYECLPKYAMFGNETATCSANGNWSHVPGCIEVTCSRPTEIENGFMSFATFRPYHYLETVEYGCNQHYTRHGPRESRCEKSGEWSAKPTCQAPCPIPVKKGKVLYNGQKVKLQDLAVKLIYHAEALTFYCKDEKRECGYTVTTQCIDGAMTIPSCFKEPPWYSVFVTDPSNMEPCPGVF